eukprot:TRINITY_DN24586_c0_g3_i1.p1 TRINITY_DN24586_c0_g3~~TRINITY_DN24586_c0_g3_i1.p1  ORF type:complete len:143 (-),score=38.09 TRINITY_DN24586_c0_g3_i1:113-541(-)
MSLGSFFGLDKIAKLGRIIKNHGGLRNSLYHLYLTDDLKEGKLMGEDQLGNKYYQNDQYFYGRNRWVVYNPKHNVDYDASMVPAEWYGWLHYKTDKTPAEKPPVKYDWMVDMHVPNPSGTKDAYMPYTTTKPKIEAWVPPKK